MPNSSRALDYPNFKWLLACVFCSTLGLQMQVILVGQQLFDLTGDPLTLGLNGLFQALPALSVALFAGTLVDSMDRKRLGLLAMMPTLLSVFGLWVLSSDMPWVHSWKVPSSFYALLVLNGLSRGFLSPTMFSLIGEILPKEAYQDSAGWNSIVWQGGTIVGPLLAGLLYSVIGPWWSFSIEFCLLCVGIFCFSQIKLPACPWFRPGHSFAMPHLKQKISEGLNFVMSSPVLLSAFALDMMAVLFGGVEAIFPVFANDVFFTGPQGLGFLRAAPAAGSTLMAIVITQLPPMNYAGRWLIFAVAGFGISTMGFAMTSSFPLALALLFIHGMFDQVSVVVRQSMTQILTPAELKGRVASVRSIFIGMSNEIGAFESGLAAKYMGTIPSVIFGSSMTLIIAFGVGLKVKGLRHFKFREDG